MPDPLSSNPLPAKKKYVRAVGPRLRILLYVIFGLVAVLGANSAYLLAIKLLEKATGNVYQNYFYQMMFLGHLVLGLLLLLPFIIFGIGHIKNSYKRPNRWAVSVGYGLFVVSLILLIAGVALVQVGGFKLNPKVRPLTYWAHVITPLMAVWL